MSQVLSDARAGGGLITAVVGGNNITVVTIAGVATVSVSGTTNHAVQVGNAMGALTSLALGNAGQVLTSNGPGLDPSFQNLPAFALTITGNNPVPVGPDGTGTINLVNANTTVDIFGNAGTFTLTQDFGISNLILGSDAVAITPAAGFNVGLGEDVFDALTDGFNNNALGWSALNSITIGNDNTAIGFTALASTLDGVSNIAIGSVVLSVFLSGQSNIGIGNAALGALTGADENVAVGTQALLGLLTGSFNTAIGHQAAEAITTGSQNTALGHNAGISWVGANSSNIAIKNIGANESNTIRIGTTGGGAGQQNRCFVAGINGVNVGSVASVVSINGDQLGSTTITAGTGVTVTPGANTITISSTGADLLAYTNVNTTPYVVLTTDEYLGVDCSGGVRTIQLPNAPSTGRVFIIKDRTGSAATNNITVTTVGGVVLIDGATTFVMNTAYESVSVLFDGSTYQIF